MPSDMQNDSSIPFQRPDAVLSRSPVPVMSGGAADTSARPAGGLPSVVPGRSSGRFEPDEFAMARRHSPYATWLIGILSALVVATLAWMHLGHLDEVATAPGIVRWAGTPRAVSHPDGGRVTEMLARNGEAVRRGQPLMLLDDDQVLLAPATGVVRGLAALNPGATIAPGETVAEIVPAEEVRRLEIEARVASADIAGIEVGQDAFLKVHAYDWSRHGTLRGTVVHIASEAVAPEPGVRVPGGLAAAQPYFVVRIAVDKDFLGSDARLRRLAPGMTVSVDFHIGERSILEHLVSGMIRTVGRDHRQGG